MEPQSQCLLEGLEGVLGVLPNPHITEVISQGQATPGLSDAKATKQQFATLRPQPPARAQRDTGGVSGPCRGHSPSPSAAPWCAWAAWSAGPRAAGGPRYSGRRPAGSAPPRQKICWAGWLVLSSVLSPRGAARRSDSLRPRLGGSPRCSRGSPRPARLGPPRPTLSRAQPACWSC